MNNKRIEYQLRFAEETKKKTKLLRHTEEKTYLMLSYCMTQDPEIWDIQTKRINIIERKRIRQTKRAKEGDKRFGCKTVELIKLFIKYIYQSADLALMVSVAFIIYPLVMTFRKIKDKEYEYYKLTTFYEWGYPATNPRRYGVGKGEGIYYPVTFYRYRICSRYYIYSLIKKSEKYKGFRYVASKLNYRDLWSMIIILVTMIRFDIKNTETKSHIEVLKFYSNVSLVGHYIISYIGLLKTFKASKPKMVINWFENQTCNRILPAVINCIGNGDEIELYSNIGPSYSIYLEPHWKPNELLIQGKIMGKGIYMKNEASIEDYKKDIKRLKDRTIEFINREIDTDQNQINCKLDTREKNVLVLTHNTVEDIIICARGMKKIIKKNKDIQFKTIYIRPHPMLNPWKAYRIFVSNFKSNYTGIVAVKLATNESMNDTAKRCSTICYSRSAQCLDYLKAGWDCIEICSDTIYESSIPSRYRYQKNNKIVQLKKKADS